MGRARVAAIAALAALAAGCGTAGPASLAPAGDGPETYAVDAIVLENAEQGPMLCLGGMPAIYPPMCGTVPLRGWDWSAVESESREGGTVWGEFHVGGTLEDGVLVVGEAGPPEGVRPGDMTEPDFSSPCPAPDGGWPTPGGATQNDAERARRYIDRQEDLVASWVTHLEPDRAEFGAVVLNAVFTGDRGRHESALAALWRGPLCVVERPGPTVRELNRIRAEAEALLPGLGAELLWSTGPAVEPVVEIGVVVDPDGKVQSAIDERFGAGVVRVIPALRPVSG